MSIYETKKDVNWGHLFSLKYAKTPSNLEGVFNVNIFFILSLVRIAIH